MQAALVPTAMPRRDPLRRRSGGLLVLGLVAALLGTSAVAAEDRPVAPTSVAPMPEPPARPAELKPEPPPTPATVPALPDAPAPPERPTELTPATPAPAGPGPGPAAEMPTPPPRPTDLSTTPALSLTVAPADDTACRKRLERLGATFEALPPIANGQCGAEKPLKLTGLAGDVALNPAATLVCATAEALARWTTEAQDSADRILKAPLRSLSVGTSYECRGQNHDPDAKLSEHSFANGVDIMGFVVEGQGPILVGKGLDGAPEATFQAAVRAKACSFFRTVLGPGSDAAHANHLHLDERERNAGHRLCQ